MTDTLRAMRLVEAIGHSRTLAQVCEVYATLPLFDEPLEAAGILTLDRRGVMQLAAAVDPQGVLGQLVQASVWTTGPLPHALSASHSSVIPRLAVEGFQGDLWVLPLRSPSHLMGAMLGWSTRRLPAGGLSTSVDTMLAAVVKSALRAHQPDLSSAVLTTPRRAS